MEPRQEESPVGGAAAQDAAGVYLRHREFVRRCLRRRGVDGSRLEDAVHDVFVVLLRRIHEYDGVHGYRAWLGGIARRVAWAHRARARKQATRPLSSAAGQDDDGRIGRSEARVVLDRFLDGIDGEQLQAFLMSEVEGCTAREVASTFDINLTTAQWRIRAARTKLRARVQQARAETGPSRPWLWFLFPFRVREGATASAGLTAAQMLVGLLVAIVAVLGLVLWGLSRVPADSGAEATLDTGGGGGRLAAAEHGPGLGGAAFEGGAILGHVLDREHRPIVGADVCAWRASSELTTGATRQPQCTRTGAGGAYALEGLVPADYRLYAGAEGYEPARYDVRHAVDLLELERGQRREGIDIILAPGGVAIRGTVLDIMGGPVEGAWVYADGRENMIETFPGVAVRSGQGGAFVLFAPRGRFSVSAVARGYAVGRAEGSAPDQGIEVMLTPESVLTGRVIDVHTAQPVTNARVFAGSEYWDPDYGDMVFTDQTGRFHIAGLKPGRYRPTARAPGYFGVAARSVGVGLAETSDDIVVRAHPTPQVHAQITIEGSEEPCPGGTVDVGIQKAAYGQRTAVIQPDGHATFDAVFPGERRFSIRCSGYVHGVQTLAIGPEPRTVEASWTVASGRTISGAVTSASGEPVERAFVFVRPVDAEPSPGTGGGTTSDPDGSFQIRGLLAGTYQVKVHDGNVSQQVTLPPNADVEDVRLELPPRASGGLRGTVRDTAGQPVPHVRIVEKLGGRNGWTNHDGSFELDRILPGEYRVRVYDEYWQALPQPVPRVDGTRGELVAIEAGEVTEIDLVVSPPSQTIRGRVVDVDGGPLADIAIGAHRESEEGSKPYLGLERWASALWLAPRTLSEEGGHFVIHGLTEGKYTVVARRRGGGDARAEGIATGTDVTIAFQPDASLSGVVAWQSGRSPDEFTIEVHGLAGGMPRTETFFRSDGRFSMGELPPGRYKVVARSAQGQVQPQQVVLEAGEARSDLRFVLDDLATVGG